MIPRAAYGIYDDNAGTFAYHRVRYDVQRTQRAILRAGLPERFATRLGHGA